MSLDRAEAAQGSVFPVPDGKLCVDDFDELIEFRKVPVVQPEFAQEFPDAFNRVKLRTVRGEEEQDEVRFLSATPLGVKTGVVILGVVDDDNDAAASAAAFSTQLAQKCPAGLGIKAAFRFGSDQATITDSHRAKVTDRLASRGVATDRVADFRRHPHATAAAMLLEVNFVQGPKIDLTVCRESLKFFLL